MSTVNFIIYKIFFNKMCIDKNRNYMTKYEKNMGIEGITPVVETVINNIKYILNEN